MDEQKKRVEESVQAAIQSAIERSDKSAGARERITNAIKNRLLPYLQENEVISSQISSDEYQQYLKDTEAFLKARIEVVQCPDGRIAPIALADPRYVDILRSPQGLFTTRSTTGDERLVPKDPDLVSELITSIDNRKKAGDSEPKVISFVGSHIDSHTPLHGCGASAAKLTLAGHAASVGMQYGGIKEYFEEIGEGFFAFDNVAAIVGGKGTTFDLTYDTYSQGVIIGLRDSYRNFNPALNLRENLLKLAQQKQIIMSELLDDTFRPRINKIVEKLGLKKTTCDMREYRSFVQNMIVIGTMARELTQEEEKHDHAFLEAHVRSDFSKIIARVLAYHIIRNVVYRVLGGIKPGAHLLLKHPETLIRVGPTGALYNVENIAFIETTPRGRIMRDDLDVVNVLYTLSQGVLTQMGVDLTKEGRVILATGVFDHDRYRTPEIAHQELNYIKGTVKYNASMIRQRYEASVETGETVVLGALFDPDTRRLTHIV